MLPGPGGSSALIQPGCTLKGPFPYLDPAGLLASIQILLLFFISLDHTVWDNPASSHYSALHFEIAPLRPEPHSLPNRAGFDTTHVPPRYLMDIPCLCLLSSLTSSLALIQEHLLVASWCPPAPALIHSPTLIQSQQVQLWTVCELLFSSPEGPDAAARGHLSPFRMQTLTVPTWLPSDKLQDIQGDAQDR